MSKPTDTALDWIRTNLTTCTTDVPLPKNEVYEAYLNFCTNFISVTPLKRPAFGKAIKLAFPAIQKHSRKGPRGSNQYCYKGICWDLKILSNSNDDSLSTEGPELNLSNLSCLIRDLRNRNPCEAPLPINDFCSCGTYNEDDNSFMIACDVNTPGCKQWYHGLCVGITEKQAEEIDKYTCPLCKDNSVPEDMSTQVIAAECSECHQVFTNNRSLATHLRLKHPSVYRSNKVVHKQPEEIFEPPFQDASKDLMRKKKLVSLNERLQKVNLELQGLSQIKDRNTAQLSLLYNELQSTLLEADDFTSVPTHPAKKYFNLRKTVPKLNQDNYKQSTNPERMSRRKRLKRMDKYNHDLVQHLYYNNRKKCVQKVMTLNENKTCQIPLSKLHQSFSSRWSTPNDNIRNTYDEQLNDKDQINMDSGYSNAVSEEDVQFALKGMKSHSASGPDKITVRTLKTLNCSPVLSTLFTILNVWNYIPPEFKEARTSMIYKSGDDLNPCNWRPISVCSAMRRLYERVILKRLRTYVKPSVFQSGGGGFPGTHVNSSIIHGLLRNAKAKKESLYVLFLDVEKAFDYIGHSHIQKTLLSLPIPRGLRDNVMNLIIGNSTRINVSGGQSKPIKFSRGVFQGSVLSPDIFNLGIDFILRTLSEDSISREFGVVVQNIMKSISALGYIDDTCIIAKNKTSLGTLARMAFDLFKEIGLNINFLKSTAIFIDTGKLTMDEVLIEPGVSVKSIDATQSIKYLGVHFRDELILDTTKILQKFQSNLELLVSSNVLNADQKLQIINEFVWPTLVYPFQSAPSYKIPAILLKDLDIILRSSVKEFMTLPPDTPNAALYSSRKKKGLGLIRSEWEAKIQLIGICRKLAETKNVFVAELRPLKDEVDFALKGLNIKEEYAIFCDETSSGAQINKKIRELLRSREFGAWSDLLLHGIGVSTFADCPSTNTMLFNKTGLSNAEWTSYFKMVSNVAAVRAIHGRADAKEGSRCRRCGETKETLAHVLGACSFGDLLRNTRHHTIRTLIANDLRDQNYEVDEEVPVLDRRIDMIVINRKKRKAYVIDPTIRMETNTNQTLEVDQEKKSFYEPVCAELQKMYKLTFKIDVIGLLIGARGTTSNDFIKLVLPLNIKKKTIQDIILAAVKGSCRILHHHLYTPIN